VIARRDSRGWARSAAAAVLLVLAGVGLPHGEAPPKPPATPPTPPTTPTPPPRYAKLDYVWPVRWSWVHWWEANRAPYLETIRQGRPVQKPDEAVRAAYRKKAVEALIKAMDSPAWQIRASAALALGRMSEASAAGRLIQAARGDGRQAVRLVALTAIGLIDCDEGRKFLLTNSFDVAAEREAAMLAVGLGTAGGAGVTVGLQKALSSGDVGCATAAAWGLRRRSDPANAPLLLERVRKSPSPWIASEAILSLGRQKAAASIKPLADILLATKWGGSIAANRLLAAAHEERLEVSRGTPVRGGGPLAALWRRSPNRRVPKAIQRSPNGDPTVGYERIYAARLRASAAIALGQTAHPAASRVLIEALEGPDDAFTDLHKGMAVLSLGRLGDPKGAAVLLSILSPTDKRGVRKSSAAKWSPLRGNAALALGLYGRPVKTPQGPRDRLHFDKVCEKLCERLADREESAEVRSAAAVALGLTGRTANLRYFHKAAATVALREDPLAGYVLLGRAMLADNNILPAAGKYLTVATDKATMAGILGRRAAVLGLGVLGNEQALPILRTCWDLNYYVAREVALAYALLGAINVTDQLVWLLETHGKPLARAFAGRCLGELFSASRPPRLSLLINGSNYTVRNDRTAPYCALANEFLYTYFIAAFGETWW